MKINLGENPLPSSTRPGFRKSVGVTKEYLELIYNATKELRIHGCTYSDIELLNKIRDRTKYYLNKME
ncbi:MAG: hypothetical protein E7C49_00060 [Clostridium sp.]|nr:hypothetical protein [Clostridium sp.]